MPLEKNVVPTSITIDLSTIDRKIEKLIKYFKNCDIDLKREGLSFINPDVNYKLLKEAFSNNKYKQSVASKVESIYTGRYLITRHNLVQRGLINSDDFGWLQPLDDFGSRFDSFGATNTDPDNIILKFLNLKPYKYLKIDFLTLEEFEAYNASIAAANEKERLHLLLQKLNNITEAHLSQAASAPSTRQYIDNITQEILTIKLINTESVPSQNAANAGDQQPLLPGEEEPIDTTDSEDEMTDYEIDTEDGQPGSQQNASTSETEAAKATAEKEKEKEQPEIYTIQDRIKEGSWNDFKSIWTTRDFDLSVEGTDENDPDKPVPITLQEAKEIALLIADRYVVGINPDYNDLNKTIRKNIKETIVNKNNKNIVSFKISGEGLKDLPPEPIKPPPPEKLLTDEEYKELLNTPDIPANSPTNQQQIKPISSDLLATYPDLKKAIDYFKPFSSIFYNFASSVYALEELQKVEPEMHDELTRNPSKIFAVDQTEKAKIKILNNLIKQVFTKELQDTIFLSQNLDEFTSDYEFFNFKDRKFTSSKTGREDLSVTPREYVYKITYLREEPAILLQKEQEKLSDLKIEFNSKTQVSIQSPFGNSEGKNSKFVAFLDNYDVEGWTGKPIELFQPTVLSILNDIDYIDAYIYEIDPFYCPPPESNDPAAIARRDKYQNDQVIKDRIGNENNKEWVESNKAVFNYKNFPDLYFIPNLYPEEENDQRRVNLFYNITDPQIDIHLMMDKIKQYSQLYYLNHNETPPARLARDKNFSDSMRNAALKNGFYGLFELRRDSFSDPFSIEKIKQQIMSLGNNAIIKVPEIISAKTNLSCLLKELQACFLPKIGRCKDVLKGFRISEIENIMKKIFPESVFVELYKAIETIRNNLIKDEEEKELLRELKELEAKLKNQERKRFIWNKLDQRMNPDEILSRADIELGYSKDNPSIQKQYEEKLKQYIDFKRNKEVIDEKNKLSEGGWAQQTDEFLNKVEVELKKWGLGFESLCDLAKLIEDLSKLSFPFPFFFWPELPDIDLFQEVKLSLDLSIIQVILQAIVEFILKILQELLTCNGFKNMVNAAMTGESKNMGLTSTALAAMNQMATGKFDLDDFVKNNPQIDPREFNKQVAQTIKSLTGSISYSETVGLDLNIGDTNLLNVDATTNIGSKEASINNLNYLLNNSEEGKRVEQILYQSFKNLISGLSTYLTPPQFLNVVSGRGTEQEFLLVVQYASRYHQELSFIHTPSMWQNLFLYLSSASGLNEVAEEVVSIASGFAQQYTESIPLPLSECEPGTISSSPSSQNLTPPSDRSSDNKIDEQLEEDRKKYGDFIRDLFKISPDEVKQSLQDKIIKPLLVGKLPNGKRISQVDQANKQSISESINNIADKFKESSNGFYSKLAYKKKVKRKIDRYIIQTKKKENEEGFEQVKIENTEFNDKLNAGGYTTSEKDKLLKDEENTSIEVEEFRYVHGAYYVENMTKAAKNFKLNAQEQEKITFELSGEKGHISEKIKDFYNSNIATLSFESPWKIVGEQTKEKTKFNIYPQTIFVNSRIDPSRGPDSFSFEIENNNSELLNKSKSLYVKYANLLKESLEYCIPPEVLEPINLESGVTVNLFDENVYEYYKDSYANFINEIYQKISQNVVSDGLLQTYELQKFNQLGIDFSSTFLADMLPQIFSNPPPVAYVDNPYVDTPLKYINFNPRPTEKQKSKNLDPSLFGKLELAHLIGQILDKRNNEILSLDDFEKIIQDQDAALNLSIIDGLFMSIIRIASADFCLRALFPLRTFLYDSQLISDLLIPTFLSEKIYKEFQYYENFNSKRSFGRVVKEHIDYLHDHVFESKIANEEDVFLFEKIKQLKNINEILKEDENIFLQYSNKITPVPEEYIEKLQVSLDCLRQEINKNEKEILKLQIRNLCYNELLVMFDKLSYITSTNKKVLDGLGEKCKKEELGDQDNILNTIITDSLLNSTVYPVDHMQNINNTPVASQYMQKLQDKYSNKILLEYYAYVPEIDSRLYPQLWAEQKKLSFYGVQTIELLRQFLTIKVKPVLGQNKLNNLFKEPIQYGMRIVYVENNIPNQGSIIDYDSEKSIFDNYTKLISQRKNKVFLKDNINYEIKKIRVFNQNVPINQIERSYSIPYLFEQSSVAKMGLINTVPLFKEQTIIESSNYSTQEFIDILTDLESNSLYKNPISVSEYSRQTVSKIKLKLFCNERLNEFYDILTSKNLISNTIIMSSFNTLGSKFLESSFASLRKRVMNNIVIKLNSIYNKNNLEDILGPLLSLENFKDFNAETIIKTAIKASIYVLSYYCQNTDPNISFAMILRNAVKIILSLASSLPSPFGENPVPKELPPYLTPLAIYSMSQLPVNIFGIPPVGIGVGPPITIPGMVLLGVELLLLALESLEDFDNNENNDDIRSFMKDFCFDIKGYKKYGT